jgi:hypothetical protein
MTQTRQNQKYQRIDGSQPWAAPALCLPSDADSFEDAATAASASIGRAACLRPGLLDVLHGASTAAVRS